MILFKAVMWNFPMPSGLSDWLTILAAVGIFLTGGGGVVAFLKQRRDAKNGIRQESRADVDSLNARAVAIVESQFIFLVKPLQEKVTGLEQKVELLQTEVEAQKTKYWKAVTHIRNLYAYIAKHMTSELEKTPPPPPPAELAGDI